MDPRSVTDSLEGASPTPVAVPIVLARFMLHLKTHGVIYAVGWLVLDATGTWAAVSSQVTTGVC